METYVRSFKVVETIPKTFLAEQFFQNVKPWHPAVKMATGAVGWAMPHVQTQDSIVAVADGDWILTERSGGRVTVANQRQFKMNYREVTLAEASASEGEQKRKESADSAREAGLSCREATSLKVETGGFLGPIRPDCPVPHGDAVGTSQVQPVPEESPRSDTGLPVPAVRAEADLGVQGQAEGTGTREPKQHSWKVKAIEYEASQDKLRERLGLPKVLDEKGEIKK